MGMKMKFDMTDSKRQLAPEGEYALRFKSKKIENSSKGKPMITLDWTPFNPPPGVAMSDIEKCQIRTWVSLAPNALFTLKNLCHACEQEITCVSCNNDYDPSLDVCPACQSPLFEVDLDFIDTSTPKAFIKIEKDQKGEKDVNTVVKYSR